jgi:hypothetical protein
VDDHFIHFAFYVVIENTKFSLQTILIAVVIPRFLFDPPHPPPPLPNPLPFHMEPTEDTVEVKSKTLQVCRLTAMSTLGPVLIVDATPLGIVGNSASATLMGLCHTLRTNMMSRLQMSPGMHYMDKGMYDLYLCPEGWTCGGKTVDPRIPLPAMCQNGWWDLLNPEYVPPKVIVEDIHYIYGIFIRDHFSRDVIRGSPQMVGPVFVDKTQNYLSHFQNLEDAEACACTYVVLVDPSRGRHSGTARTGNW